MEKGGTFLTAFAALNRENGSSRLYWGIGYNDTANCSTVYDGTYTATGNSFTGYYRFIGTDSIMLQAGSVAANRMEGMWYTRSGSTASSFQLARQ